MSSYQSLRDRQVGSYFICVGGKCGADVWTASIERILNLNHASAESSHLEASASNGVTPKSTPILNSDGEPIWKVLVFDNLGRDVISSVLRVSDLRSWGITIHLYV